MILFPKLNIDFKFKDFFYSVLSFFSKIKIVNDETLFLNHARTGLRIALSSLDLPHVCTVGMTVYNCDTVMHAIQNAGYTIEFIDVTDNFTIDLVDLEKKKQNIDVLIVTHLYGIVNDVDQIKQICPNIPLIEDCAHAFLSANDKNEAGSLGDMAIFSIGLGKFPSISEGGLLRINNNKYSDKLRLEYEKLSSYSLQEELKLLLKNLFYSIAYIPFIYGSFTKNIKKNRVFNKSVAGSIERKISKQSLYLFHLKKNDFMTYKNIQQNNVSYILSKIKDNTNIRVPNYDFHDANGFMLPVLISDREKFLLSKKNLPIEITTHFRNSIEWAKAFDYKENYCLNAEKIVGSIIIIPTHYNLKKRHVEKLIKVLQNEK